MSDPIRAFRRAAGQRQAAAEFLLKGKLSLDASYLAGYAIECALKALILARTPNRQRRRQQEEISRGKGMHSHHNLAEILKRLGCPIPLRLAKKLRRANWSTDLRYESGRGDYEQSREFLGTVEEVLKWVDGNLT
jgi:HEPN domain-containing protein